MLSYELLIDLLMNQGYLISYQWIIMINSSIWTVWLIVYELLIDLLMNCNDLMSYLWTAMIHLLIIYEFQRFIWMRCRKGWLDEWMNRLSLVLLVLYIDLSICNVLLLLLMSQLDTNRQTYQLFQFDIVNEVI